MSARWSRKDILEAYFLFAKSCGLGGFGKMGARAVVLHRGYMPQDEEELTANGKLILKQLKERQLR